MRLGGQYSYAGTNNLYHGCLSCRPEPGQTFCRSCEDSLRRGEGWKDIYRRGTPGARIPRNLLRAYPGLVNADC